MRPTPPVVGPTLAVWGTPPVGATTAMRPKPPPPPCSAGRRALLAALAACAVSPPAVASSGRVTAQSVGIDQTAVGVLSDPRALVGGEGLQPIIWGGRERCDPTDVTCKQGGESADGLAVQPVPVAPSSAGALSDRVNLEMSVGGERVGVLELGLWRAAAPSSVDAFVRLSGGRYVSRPGEDPASLERSVAARVLKDRAVVLGALKQTGGSTVLVAGKTRPQLVPVAPPATDDPPNGLAHSAAGLLSVASNGGTFEFTLLPRANAALDKTNIVIGQVLNADGMAILERLNVLATDNYQQRPLATVRIERATVVAP